MHVSAPGSAYARRCWIWACTPVRASGKATASPGLLSTAPIPPKLFFHGATAPPKRYHPVSTMPWTKATSPVTLSIRPSSTKCAARASTGSVAA